MATKKETKSKPSNSKESKGKLNKIKYALLDAEKSQRWLSEQMNVGENTVSNWTSNRNQPSLPDLKKIAGLLDVSMCELLNE